LYGFVRIARTALALAHRLRRHGVLQVTVACLARDWRVAALLIILERIGKAILNSRQDAILAHATKQIGFGWAFGVHEVLDQFGALFGRLTYLLRSS